MAIDIARRKFIVALGRIAFAWPLAAHAQQAALPVIDFATAPRQQVAALLINGDAFFTRHVPISGRS